jgi:predicted RNase H-like nuclease (RuvC/YqgF family)
MNENNNIITQSELYEEYGLKVGDEVLVKAKDGDIIGIIDKSLGDNNIFILSNGKIYDIVYLKFYEWHKIDKYIIEKKDLKQGDEFYYVDDEDVYKCTYSFRRDIYDTDRYYKENEVLSNGIMFTRSEFAEHYIKYMKEYIQNGIDEYVNAYKGLRGL